VDASLLRAARTAALQCLGVGAGDAVLVVTDPPCVEVGTALWEAAKEAGAEAMLLWLLPRKTHGSEPPQPVAEAMRHARVCFLPTSRSLTHTVARRQASEAGARVASLPGITPEIFQRAMDVDYHEVRALTLRVGNWLEQGTEVRLTSPAGTDLCLSIAGRTPVLDTGLYLEPGSFGNLPAGEAYVAPVEGTAEGVLVVDGSMAGVTGLDAPIRIEVIDGRAGAITGGRAAMELAELLTAAGEDARTLAELGVGTNASARISGHVLEDEKVLGTVHVALGANASFGGKVQVACHLDGILRRPSMWVDGRQVMREGELFG